MNKMESTTLYCQEGKSDKVYIVSLEPHTGEDDWVVNYQNGRRGGTLAGGTKTEEGVSYDEAKEIYDKVIKDKTKKGYEIDKSAPASFEKVEPDPNAKKKGKEFELFYHVSNNGDGSASTHFHATRKDAERAEKDEYEGFAEDTVDSVTMKIVEGKLYFQDYDDDYKKIWLPVKEA